MFKTWRSLQYYYTLYFKINKLTMGEANLTMGEANLEDTFKWMTSIFIFSGNIFILLLPSILNILIRGL